MKPVQFVLTKGTRFIKMIRRRLNELLSDFRFGIFQSLISGTVPIIKSPLANGLKKMSSSSSASRSPSQTMFQVHSDCLRKPGS